MSDGDNEKLNRLLIALANGHADCLDGIYRIAAKQMFAVAYGVLHDRAAAEDAVHDSFLKIAKNAHQYRRDTNPAGWLMRLTRNTALDTVRRYGRRREIGIDELAPLSSLDYSPEQREDAILLEGALSALDERERQAIYCKYYLDLTVRETAQELKISKSAAERTLQRAEQKLKKEFADGTKDDGKTLHKVNDE